MENLGMKSLSLCANASHVTSLGMSLPKSGDSSMS